MSFDLTVSTPQRPTDLKSAWERELSTHGFVVEICPGFDPATWAGGFLPFRIEKAPRMLIGAPLKAPALSGFEVAFTPEEAHFRTSAGRTATEFALQCLGAAALACICGGQYTDPQNSLARTGNAAIVAAVKEIKAFVATASERERAQRPFVRWGGSG